MLGSLPWEAVLTHVKVGESLSLAKGEAAKEKCTCRCLGIQATLPLTLEPLAVTGGWVEKSNLLLACGFTLFIS